MARTYGKAQDLIDFTRASGGTALRRVKYGAELVTNGTFDSDVSGWSDLVGTSAYSSGTLQFTSSGGGQGAYQSFSTTAGKVYRAEATSTSASISHLMRIHNTDAPSSGVVIETAIAQTSPSTFVVIFVAQSDVSNIYLRSGSAGVVNWDNVSVKEVTFDTSDGDLILFNHPNNIPRIEYDASGNLLGLLVEESRTNLVDQSDAENWDLSGAVTSIDLNGNYLGFFGGSEVYSNGATWHRIENRSLSLTSGVTYSATFYFKAGTSGRIRVLLRDANNALESFITASISNLASPSIYQFAGTVSNYAYEDFGNDIYKITFNLTPTNSGLFFIGIGPDSATIGQTVIGLGAQLEAGSFPTSYIPTSGSTATRSADVASLSTSGFGFNAEQGAFVMNVRWAGNSPDVSAVVHLGDSSDRHLVYYNNGYYRYQVKSGNSVQAQMTAVAQDVDDVLVMSYKANSFYFGDGDQVSLDSAGLLPDVTITSLDIGGYDGDNHFNGHIKSIKYLPRQLTQSQLEALTA